MSNNTFRTHYAPSVRLHDWPSAILNSINPTLFGSGIVDCTVGNILNPNAKYNSVQTAFDDGCFFVRVIDGLTGGQVPGYIESAFTVPPLQPVMIYIDPGVDWVLDVATIGVGGVVLNSASITFRGSGYRSVIRQIMSPVPPAQVFSTDAFTQIWMLDLQVETTTEDSFFPGFWSRLNINNVRWVLTNNPVVADNWTLDLRTVTGETELNQVIFVTNGTNNRVINTFTSTGSFVAFNLVHRGPGGPSLPTESYAFQSAGQLTLVGFTADIVFPDTLDITLGGAGTELMSDINDVGGGTLNVIFTGANNVSNVSTKMVTFAGGSNTVNNLFVSVSTVSLSAGGNIINGLTISNASSPALTVTGGFNHLSDVSVVGSVSVPTALNVINGLRSIVGGITVSGDSNQISNLTDLTTVLTVSGSNNSIDGIQGIDLVISGMLNVINDGHFTGDVSVIAANNFLGNLILPSPEPAGTMTISGANTAIDSCQIGTLLSIAVGANDCIIDSSQIGPGTVAGGVGITINSNRCVVSNCNTTGSILITSTNNSLSNIVSTTTGATAGYVIRLSGMFNSLSNIQMPSVVGLITILDILASANHINNIVSTSTSIINLASMNIVLSNSIAGRLLITAEECQVNNCNFLNGLSALINGNEAVVNNNTFQGTVSMGTTATSTESVLSGNFFTGLLTIGGFVAFSCAGSSFTGNVFQGGSNLTILLRANSDSCVFAGNKFNGVLSITIGADATPVPPLFTGNMLVGTATTGPLNSNAVGAGNVI